MSTAVIVMVVLLLVFLFMKVPVFIAVLGASAAYFILTPATNFMIFAQQAVTGAEGISLLAIPFFVCAGALMNYTGVTKRIMDFCATLTGRMHGGLAQVNVLLSTLMGGLSGSALADAAMEAKMLVPEMERNGFSKPFSAVVTAASSMITPLIPPGICLILYGCIANISIGKLFIAGIGPGALLCVTMMVLVSQISKKRGYGSIRKEKMTGSMFRKTFKPAILPLCLPVIILGGIRLGIFTATEAGSVAIIYALLLGIFYRDLSKRDFFKGIQETLLTTSSILLIVAAASTFSWILTKEQLPQRFTQWMISVIDNKWIFLVAVDIFLIIIGMFIEGNASMIILVPLFAPVAAAYGIDPIHFAVMFIFANMIGAFTPPMGTLMFVVCGVTECKTKAFIKEAVPFYILCGICLLFLTFVPVYSTFLVNLVY
ncbi:MAG: TRAP transporter large permease [Eubacteriales bacterium]|nr:TRAP transporter large permease [Eubacteriales bacterium]